MAKQKQKKERVSTAKPKKKKDTKADNGISLAKGVKLSVKQVGWQNETSNFELVLLTKKQREQFGLSLNSVVRVKKGVRESLALVQKQFKQHIKLKGCCTLNTKLGYLIGAYVEDEVIITNDVTESEYKEFKEKMPKNPLAMLFGGLQDIQ